MICPYCNNEAPWVENKELYGKNYGKSYMMYLCKPCNAYVGCHENTRKPLGTMTNSEGREWRKKAHAAIDPLWKSKQMSRNDVYTCLKVALGKEIHVGESDVEQCKRIIEIAESIIV